MAPGTNRTDRTPLDDRVAFLLSQIGFHSAALFSERLQPLGLQPRQFAVLSQLTLLEGQTQQQLANALTIHRNAMVGLLDELEQHGLVERQPHSSDRRAHAIRLTSVGRRLLSRAQVAADEVEAELTGGLGAATRRQLIILLRRVAADAGLQAWNPSRPEVTARLTE